MKLTVMIQRRWWSAVTKIFKIRTKNKYPGVMWIYITTQMENTKIRKMKKSRGEDLVWFAQKGPDAQKGPKEILTRDEEVCCINCSFTYLCESEGYISTGYNSTEFINLTNVCSQRCWSFCHSCKYAAECGLMSCIDLPIIAYGGWNPCVDGTHVVALGV